MGATSRARRRRWRRTASARFDRHYVASSGSRRFARKSSRRHHDSAARRRYSIRDGHRPARSTLLRTTVLRLPAASERGPWSLSRLPGWVSESLFLRTSVPVSVSLLLLFGSDVLLLHFAGSPLHWLGLYDDRSRRNSRLHELAGGRSTECGWRREFPDHAWGCGDFCRRRVRRNGE